MIKFVKPCIPVLLVMTATPVFAWGRTGHWLTGRIAELQLAPSTKKAVEGLLAQDQNIPVQTICGNAARNPEAWTKPTSLANIASFPDQIRTAPIGDGTASWHFVNIEHDDPGTSFNWTSYCKGTFKPKYSYDAGQGCYKKLDAGQTPEQEVLNCSLFKIEDFFRTLAIANAPAADKLWALKFIVHVVGDAHQPLHNAVWNNDRGGNLRAVSFMGDPDPFYGPLNLHSIWDDNMIERAIRKHLYNDESPRKLTDDDLEKYAQYLNSRITRGSAQTFNQATIDQWLMSGPTEWGWIALQKAVQFAYTGFTKEYTPIPQNVPAGVVIPRVEITAAYYNNAVPVLEEQIEMGAKRLAALLDQSLN